MTEPPPAPGPPGPVPLPPTERVRVTYQQRPESDYVFSFWTAFGWTLLTCGIYGFYVLYQLVRRSRDHNRRRLEQLEGANALAWEHAQRQGLTDELRPDFERVAGHLSTLRQMTTDFRDPTIWLLIAIGAALIGSIGWQFRDSFTDGNFRFSFGGWGPGIVYVVVWILLDKDLVKHDFAEGGAEHELSGIYGRLGHPLPSPDPAALKQPHNHVGRVIAAVLTCGIYGLWWLYDEMTDGNRHFEKNWVWEDALAGAVRSMT